MARRSSRASRIEWVGLDRETPTPPAVHDPTRDEFHLINGSVQTGTLTGIDSDQVYTATTGVLFTMTSSFRRERVAWIHLGRPADRGVTRTTESGHNETKRDEKKPDDSSASGPTDAWRVPPNIFIWMPRQCASCLATLHVLDLVARNDAVFLTKSRVISISSNLVVGSWFAYDPPPRLFPGTIATERLAQDLKRQTWVTEHHYLENRYGGSRGGSQTPGTPGGPRQGSSERTPARSTRCSAIRPDERARPSKTGRRADCPGQGGGKRAQ